MIDRKILASVLIVVAISGTGVVATLFNGYASLQIPPPSTPPGNDIQVVSAGELDVWAETSFSQDFMPIVPPEGAPFYSLIKINITNHGDKIVTDISALRATIYYNGTLSPLVTLNLTTSVEYIQPINVSPSASIVVEFINDRGEIYSPTIEEGTGLYARILFTWGDGQQTILTTTPTALLFTY